MSEFADFHVVLSPNLQEKGSWDVLLEDCAVPGLAGDKGRIQPAFTTEQLAALRNRHGWPNADRLHAIGESVWNSLMTPQLSAAFAACLAQAHLSNQGTRVIVSMIGEEPEAPGAQQIRLQELPLEALYSAQVGYLAPNPLTPVSRSLKFKRDREPYRVIPPLLVLAIVATPQDKPAATMQDEKDVIKNALQPLIDVGAVDLQFCEPPTRTQLAERLKEGFHILHFVGHGAYEIVGDDPTPRPHLCLEDNTQSDPLDAETLEVMLQTSGVHLVVMTACSSAAPTPQQVGETVSPLEGVAQRLVAGVSGVNAVVAMQFDLESQAAVTFSGSFYGHLLQPGRKLDEVVALCRRDLVSQMNAGHRAWVTPVVYWRCKNGELFEIAPMRKPIDSETREKLKELDATLEVYLKHISETMDMPQEIRDAAAPLLARWQGEVDSLQQQRGDLLGETLRLRGGQVKPGETIQCRLNLRLRSAAQIDDVEVRVLYPPDKVDYQGASEGASCPGNAPLVGTPAAGQLRVMVQGASQGAQWAADEHELALLSFEVKAGVSDPIVEISLADASVERDGTDTPFEALNAFLFVS